MEYIKKYKLKSSTLLIMVILTIICMCGCIYFSYCLNLDEKELQHYTTLDPVALKTIKDIFVILTSILGTNLLLNSLIEVRSKNQIITDVIENDVISSPKFYEEMSEENKLKMCNALENNLYYKYDIVHQMFDDIRKRLNDKIEEYYYVSCEYDVTCDINDKFIEKQISKTIAIRSYEDKYTINDFCISQFSSKQIAGVSSFELTSLKINGETKSIKETVKTIPNEVSRLGEQNEYDISNCYIYNIPIEISKDKETTICVQCTTRTSIDDRCSTFRVTKPCKNFLLVYNLNQQKDLRLSVDAFGFIDDANNSTNNTSKSNVNIKFNDWIFENDGVVVTILDKK